MSQQQTFRDEIKPGDRIMVAPRDTELPVWRGHVAAIEQRDEAQLYIVVAEGKELERDGAQEVSDLACVLSVWRGDCWFMLPLPRSREDVAKSIERMDKNERKRVQANMPLFAEVHPARSLQLPDVLQRIEAGHAQDYAFNRERAYRVMDLYDQARAQLSPEAFAAAQRRRATYPPDARYSLSFWADELEKKEGQ